MADLGTISASGPATLADPSHRLPPDAETTRHATRFDSAQRDKVTARAPVVMLSPSPSLEGKLRRSTKVNAEHNLRISLEPVARRMERVKLSPQFLRDVLVPGATLELNELAMRWAGMPNKNERAAIHEALEALTAAGFLERAEGETWTVLRAAD